MENKAMVCPCCSGRLYNDCCKPFIEQTRYPQSAEELMRSRFSAFALGELRYLIWSLHPDKRYDNLEAELKESLKNTKYLSLSILLTSQGKETDKTGKVEFVAEYELDGKIYHHKELSRFKRYKSRWVYYDGEVSIA